MDNLPEFSNTNMIPPISDSSIPQNEDIKNKSTLSLIGSAWRNMTGQQKTVLASMLVLVLGLPVIVGGLYGTKLINQKAYEPITVPITEPYNSPTPAPTNLPTSTPNATPPPSVCVPVAPTVVLEPQTNVGYSEKKYSLTLTVTNNNPIICGTSKYQITSSYPTNWGLYSDNPNTFPLSPGQSYTYKTIISVPITPPGDYFVNFSVNISDPFFVSQFVQAKFKISPRPIQIIQNGSFETDSDNDRIPNSWNWYLAKIGTTEGRICGLPVYVATGNCSFKFSASLSRKSLTQEIIYPAPKGSTYELKAKVKAQGVYGVSPFQVTTSLMDEAGNLFDTTNYTFKGGTYGFTEFSPGVKTASKPFSKIRVSLRFGQTAGTAYFDDVALYVTRPTPTSTPTPYPSTPSPATPKP